MTAQKAKELSLDVWGYLKDHPEIMRKQDLPIEIFSRIQLMEGYCPLCEYFETCQECPLNFCGNLISSYYKWRYSTNRIDRKTYATEIYNKIKDWKIEEENE